MNKAIYFSLFLLIIVNIACSQSIDDSFSQEKMLKDLEVFKNIRLEANSGLYKYRTKQEIDSIYNWANKEVQNSSTYLDFYNIICQLTDFEGSTHNGTNLPTKFSDALRGENSGYFPYPLKYIENKWIINYDKGAIPLGAEIISINNEKIDNIIKTLNKYYTTDGVNKTGKRISLEVSFGKYYRLNYGLNNQFIIEYKTRISKEVKKEKLSSISYKGYYKNANKRYSRPVDYANFKEWKENEAYNFKTTNNQTGILRVNSFGLGDEKDPRHLRYVSFLDSVFTTIKHNKIKNLIVDVRYNGGGDDPNDVVTYSYLTNRNFSENKQAWISFKKIPLLKYYDSKVPRFLRSLFVGKYDRIFQKGFPEEKNGKFYQDSKNKDQISRRPNENAFSGNIYLLVGPRVASAGSLFAAMVASNKNTVVIGEETTGGYYGHNGHIPMEYKLPKSKLGIRFFAVNLEQDVPKKENQIYNRGIIPDYNLTQTFEGYLHQKDSQMEFVLELIEKN